MTTDPTILAAAERQRAELARRARLVDFRTWRPTPEQEAAEWASVIEDLRAHFFRET